MNDGNCDSCGEYGDLEVMPCCNGKVCWDFCLYEEPKKCPLCGSPIEVVMKEAETKASYVRRVGKSRNRARLGTAGKAWRRKRP